MLLDHIPRLSAACPTNPFPQPRCTAAWPKPFQINALNLVGKISLPSSLGENSPVRRENAETLRLITLKVARKSFVFKGVWVVVWGANPVELGGDWSSKGNRKGETLWAFFA